MSKKIILFLISVTFFCFYNFAQADLIINEIMYNPFGADTNVEWIEVQNTGNSEVDLATYYVTDYDTLWHFHAITGESGTILNAGAYALIVHTSQSNFADFKTKMPNFNGLLFRASFTLGNDTGRLGLSSDHTNVSSDTAYTASADTSDTDNSLQLVSGSWIGATATPGVANEATISTTSTDSGSASNSNSTISSTQTISTTTAPKTKIVETPKIKTQIIAKTLGFVGLPLFFNATTLGLNGEQLHFGKYFWNFGDGDSKEMQVNNSEQFNHTYFYPGDYIVSLDYYQNPYSSVSDASNQITIKIVPNDIFISKVGDEKDFFVELTNNTNYDADISNWILESSLKSFVFPKNTIIGSKKKIIFSPKITNLSVNDKNTLKLMTPQRETVSDYSTSILAPVVVVPIKTPSKNTVQQKTSTTPDQIKNSTAVESIEENSATSALDEQIPVENLSASVVASDVIKDNPVRTYFLTTILTVFLGLSAGAVYFIRQKKMVSRIGDDFKILDE